MARLLLSVIPIISRGTPKCSRTAFRRNVRPFTMSMSFMLSPTLFTVTSPLTVATPWLWNTPRKRSSHSDRKRCRCSGVDLGIPMMRFGVASLKKKRFWNLAAYSSVSISSARASACPRPRLNGSIGFRSFITNISSTDTFISRPLVSRTV